MSGFIPIRRSLFEHFLFKESRSFSRFEAWMDLIQMASFTDENAELINGRLFKANRGEKYASVRFLMKRWNWSMSKVNDFIELLRTQNMAVVDKESGINKISLVNYEEYNDLTEGIAKKISKKNKDRYSQIHTDAGIAQDRGSPNDTQIDTATDTARDQRGISEGSNLKKVNEFKEGECMPEYTHEQIEKFKQFMKWVDKHAARVNQMREPLTVDQYYNLQKKFTGPVLTVVLKSMHNHAELLKKYISANLTIQNWAKRVDEPAEKNQTNEKIKQLTSGKT